MGWAGLLIILIICIGLGQRIMSVFGMAVVSLVSFMLMLLTVRSGEFDKTLVFVFLLTALVVVLFMKGAGYGFPV